MEYVITNYTPADQDHLCEFFADVFCDMGFDFDLGEKDHDLTEIPEVYQKGKGCFLLAEQGDNIIGTIALREFKASTLELKRFYVHPDYRYQGLGTALLRRVIVHAKSCECNVICLDTTSRSGAAIALFKKHGFRDIQRFNDDPFAEFFMELRIMGANQPLEPTA